MMALAQTIKQRFFAVPYREITFAHRGFEPCEPSVRARIEEYFVSFLDGYHWALETENLEQLGARLNQSASSELIGFAYEGAGMHLALLDFLTPWKSDRVARFIAGPARQHDFITLIGIGLAFARLPWLRWNINGALQRLDPAVGWFAVDGYGFHEGFFHHQKYIDQQQPPSRLSGYAANCFDNGLGRSLWFVKGAEPERVAATIAAFPEARRADLWAGVGLACAFAGGVYTDLATYATVIQKLNRFASDYRQEFGLGVVFAADTRYKANSASPWTSAACELVLGMHFAEAGQLAKWALATTQAELRHASPQQMRKYGYESGRQRIMQALAIPQTSR